jgi:hypothetical protein
VSDLRMYSQDTDYIELPFKSEADPSALTVKMAITPVDTPAVPADLVTAEWVPGETWTSKVRNVRLLVGPTSPFGSLAPGIYRMYVSVDDNPEDPFKVAPNYLVIT